MTFEIIFTIPMIIILTWFAFYFDKLEDKKNIFKMVGSNEEKYLWFISMLRKMEYEGVNTESHKETLRNFHKQGYGILFVTQIRESYFQEFNNERNDIIRLELSIKSASQWIERLNK